MNDEQKKLENSEVNEEDLVNEATETEDETLEEEVGGTPTPEEREEVEEEVEEEKTLTQSKVNELIGQARREGREAALREIEKIKGDSVLEGRNGYISEMLSRYGVSNEDELNNLFGQGQAYESLSDDYNAQTNSLRALQAENALLRSNVREDKYEDIKLILTGKGLDVTIENINELLPTHPEWKQSVSSSGGDLPNGIVKSGEVSEGTKPTTLSKLGSDVSTSEKEEPMSEFDRAKKLFGI